jgi:hypothetical protein
MGGAADLVVGALLRVLGKYDQNNLVHGEQLVVLTRVAKVLGQWLEEGESSQLVQ